MFEPEECSGKTPKTTQIMYCYSHRESFTITKVFVCVNLSFVTVCVSNEMRQGNLCSVDTYISYNICASADNDPKNHRKMENNSFTRDVFKTKFSLKILCFLLVLIIVGYCISIYFVPSVLSVLQQENCLFPTLQLLLTLIFVLAHMFQGTVQPSL